MAHFVSNHSGPATGSSSQPAKQLGPSERYINEIFNQFVAQVTTLKALSGIPGYESPDEASFAQNLLECHLNDLHPDYKLGEKVRFSCTPDEIASLQRDVLTIDREEVARRGGLPERWLIPMLARRHGVIVQEEVFEVVEKAFQIQVECVYSNGYPVTNLVDLPGDPKAKIYTDAEVIKLRDALFTAYQTKVVDPVLTALVSNQQNIRQSVVKDIVSVTLKHINAK